MFKKTVKEETEKKEEEESDIVTHKSFIGTDTQRMKFKNAMMEQMMKRRQKCDMNLEENKVEEKEEKQEEKKDIITEESKEVPENTQMK